MKYTFCPTCGTKLTQHLAGDDGLVPFSPSCDRFWFPTFSDCIIVLVANEENEIVLAKMTYWFNKTETLMHGFIGYIKKQDLILSTELESAKWIPVADVPKYLFPESPDNAAFAVYRRFLEEIKAVH